jgi:rod shape-determining protein MreD
MIETDRSGFYEKILIIGSAFLALVLTVMPLPFVWQAYRPDWALLFVLYWGLRSQMASYFMLIAWAIGLLKDGLVGSLLGQHALILSVAGYLILKMERQVNHFSLIQQAMIVIGMSFLTQGFLYLIQSSIAHPPYDLVGFWIAPIITGILWPWWASLLDLFD